jgi:P2 family phage major capsid protein
MRTETRTLFNAYLDQLAKLNGIPDARQKFAATPAVEQKLEERIQDSSDFLSRINVFGVDNQSGEKVGIDVGSTIASTTDTGSGAEREPVDPSNLDAHGYMCTQTNFDTALRYAKLDAWRHLRDFQAKIRNAILKRQALDRMMIGFNGISRAATSDRAANQLLQDVNIGWLQKWRLHAADQVMDESEEGSGVVGYGSGAAATYQSLDALVYDASESLIDPQYRDGTDLVAIVGRDILHDKYFPLINQDHKPTEVKAMDLILGAKRIGGLPAMRASGFPAGKILITPLTNLSIYWQRESRRRLVQDNPKRDRIENYESVNEAYVVEDYRAGCLIENITEINA